MYQKFSRPNSELIGSYLTPEGPKRFGREIPDAYDKTLREVLLYHGCFFHPHLRAKCFARKGLEQRIFKVGSITMNYKEYLAHCKRKTNRLRRQYKDEIIKITPTHECEFDEKLKSPDFKAFLSSKLGQFSFCSRLVPRESLCSPRKEVLNLLWEKIDKNENFFLLDMNMCYTNVLGTQKFPIGKYEVWLTDQIEAKVFLESNILKRHDGIELSGFVKAILLPPNGDWNGFLPFLNMNISKTKVTDPVAALCFTCASEGLSDICNHGDEKRQFIITTTISSLNYS